MGGWCRRGAVSAGPALQSLVLLLPLLVSLPKQTNSPPPFPLQNELVIIDVSQSVDLDHPKALDFLREDTRHVNDFFRCVLCVCSVCVLCALQATHCGCCLRGIAVLTGRDLFDFVWKPQLLPHL